MFESTMNYEELGPHAPAERNTVRKRNLTNVLLGVTMIALLSTLCVWVSNYSTNGRKNIGESLQSTPYAPMIITEDIDFIFLRLLHLLDDVPTEIESLRELLKKEMDETPGYKEAWDEGTEIFNIKKNDLVDAEQDQDIPEEYHIALITYTIHDTPKNNPFYAMFNTATRNLCSGTHVKQFPFKSFFQLLRLAIRTLNKKPKFSPKEVTLYRGETVRHDFKQGSQVAFQQFVSLSDDRSVSEFYSGNITLLEFDKMTHVGIQMKYHSKFPDESEILVSPFQIYEIKEVQLGHGKTFDSFRLEPLTHEPEFHFVWFPIKESKNRSR